MILENPILFYKNPKWILIVFEIANLISILFCLGMTIRGGIEKDWFLCVYGIGCLLTFFLIFRYYRGDIRGYVAVYSNKIVENKKNKREVIFNDVIEIRYFKKEIRSKQTSYKDCLHFYVKDQTVPVLISPSFKSTVTPYTVREETTAILTYIRVNFPFIKYTKEEWKGTY
jgi:hypothetical protein